MYGIHLSLVFVEISINYDYETEIADNVSIHNFINDYITSAENTYI